LEIGLMKKDIVHLDLFSGAGGFAQGLKQAGFNATKHYFSEIDKHAIANYKHNFKDAQYVGSVTDVRGGELPERPNVITFGSPCQDFSLAGKRKGMDGERSSLVSHAIRLITECRPDVFIWENVKGTFSSNNGADFWAIIQAFANIGGYRLEWQLLNTAWVLPQNRERIYLVGYSATPKRGWRGVFPIREETGKLGKIKQIASLTGGQLGRVLDPHGIGYALSACDYKDPMKVEVQSATSAGHETATEGDSINLAQPNSKTRRGRVGKGKAQTLETSCNQAVVCLTERRTDEAKKQRRETGSNDFRGKQVEPRTDGCVGTILGNPTIDNTIQQASRIRRLTEIECERLQGFPDNWTKYGINDKGETINISRTQRYKLMGNAVTVNVVQMIAKRLIDNSDSKG
jgi:DNA (cytosine-5)-methyltransferase 1